MTKNDFHKMIMYIVQQFLFKIKLNIQISRCDVKKITDIGGQFGENLCHQ